MRAISKNTSVKGMKRATHLGVLGFLIFFKVPRNKIKKRTIRYYSIKAQIEIKIHK